MEKNLIFKNFGIFVNTKNGEQYEIKNVVIFKNNEIKIIANYFLDNFKEYQCEFNGETKRKLKEDLTADYNFVVKSKTQYSWNDKTQYDLYINGELNNYIFKELKLIGTRLELCYTLNNVECTQCVGWNQKESNKYKYVDFENAYKNIHAYSIDNSETEQRIKDLLTAYKNYKKALETEKTYTATDYKKMQLESGTTKKENLTMLKNNGFDITGIESEDQE